MPKKTKKTPEESESDANRRKVKAVKYKSFKLEKKIKRDGDDGLPGGFSLLKMAFGVIFKRAWLFLGIVTVYGLLNVVLVQSFSSVNLEETKKAFESAFAGNWSQFLGGLSLFAFLVGDTSQTNTEAAGAYRFMLIIMTSLALIWTLRQIYTDKVKKIRIRDGFYQGMHPLVPFVFVLLFAAIQLLPVVVGAYVYGFIGAAGPVVGTELAIWLVALFALALWSLYMVSSTIFSLYIVCLPGVTPMAALRSSVALVRHRRWLVMRRIIFLPLAIFVIGAVIMVPAILFLTPVAAWIFFLLTLIALPLVHSYLYALYRRLL